jgi:hypothetical protein
VDEFGVGALMLIEACPRDIEFVFAEGVDDKGVWLFGGLLDPLVSPKKCPSTSSKGTLFVRGDGVTGRAGVVDLKGFVLTAVRRAGAEGEVNTSRVCGSSFKSFVVLFDTCAGLLDWFSDFLAE